MRHKHLRTVAECQAAFAKASRDEREQIVAFIRGGTEFKRLAPFGVFGLTHINNLDTGRKILTAWTALDGMEDGLNANAIRKIVGLKPLKGGDYKVAKGKRQDAKPERRPSRFDAKPISKVAKPIKRAKR